MESPEPPLSLLLQTDLPSYHPHQNLRMSPMASLPHVSSLFPHTPNPRFSRPQLVRHSTCFHVRHRFLLNEKQCSLASHFFTPRNFRIRSLDSDNDEAEVSNDDDDLLGSVEISETGVETSFLAKVAIALGIAATVTLISICIKHPSLGSSNGLQFLPESASSSAMGAAAPVGFTFKFFGYSVVLPEYAPGWIYFWLLMAAGFGLFISEEALNIWVGMSLARRLCLDGTWQSFAESFSRNAPYIISTTLWVYWGVCISDLIPFYLGKLFRQSRASADVFSKLGIGKEKALSITLAVQKYGNLIGFVERFSLGVRNPTAFLAGTLGISSDCFFAGVCLGGLITLPIQFGIGFFFRERPVFALATVVTVVGIWTIFPYAVTASTALFLYLRQRYSTSAE